MNNIVKQVLMDFLFMGKFCDIINLFKIEEKLIN